MAKWIKIALWWLIIKLFLAIDGMISRSHIGGVVLEAITRHPPPSPDEIERVLREQIAQRRLVDAERERFFFEGDGDEFNT